MTVVVRGQDAVESPASGPIAEVVVIATSAGGLNALTHVLGALPDDFPVPVVVVQHLHREAPSLLADILNRRCSIEVRQAVGGEPLLPGTVYLPVHNKHLVVTEAHTVDLADGPLVHFVRPSADILFESASAAYGPGVVAVVLTGAGVDGAAGVQAVKGAGGQVMVQDEQTCQSFGMPAAAMGASEVDQVLPLDDIAAALLAIVRERPAA